MTRGLLSRKALLAVLTSASLSTGIVFAQDAEIPGPVPAIVDIDPSLSATPIVLGELAPADENRDTTAEVPDGVTPEVIRERHPNRTVKVEREAIQDERQNYINHGRWRMWNPRGALVAEGQYRYGERHGTWNAWYLGNEVDLFSQAPYDQFKAPFISQATFEQGKLHGNWTVYDAKQRKISEWAFQDGLRHGKWTSWYANGNKMRDITYVDGEIEGELLQWNPEGQLVSRDLYLEGRLLAKKAEYDKDVPELKVSEGTYLHAKRVPKSNDDWWNMALAKYVVQGKDEKHGEWKSWYPSGQEKLAGRYDHNLPVGKFTWWHQNGQKSLEGIYDDGKQEGRWVWWHTNGQKSIQGEYATSGPTGNWLWWKLDGKVAQRADFSRAGGEPNIIAEPQPVIEEARAVDNDEDSTQSF